MVDVMIDNVKLTIRIFSIAVGVLLSVAAWVWFIITICDYSHDWTLSKCRICLLWIMLHMICIFGLILWAWC